MYSLMIVDDEEIIRNGIRDAVSASPLPLKSIRIAPSAREALEMLERSPCDIILSDIRMRDMDGLEMVERAKKIWPETRVIFLTGYQDFEYARKALRLNSDDFLLKPVPDEKLIEVIGNVISKLDGLWLERFELRYRKSMEICEIDSEVKVPVHILLIAYEAAPERMSKDELHKSLCGMLTRLFRHYCSAAEFEQEESCTIARLQPMVEEGYWGKVCWKTLEELQSFFLEHLDVKMSIGLSEGVDPDETGLIMQRMKAECLRRDNFGGLLRFPIEEKAENGNENYAVKAIQSYIRKNPGKDLSLGALSEKFRINPSYLSRVFHQETGTPISEFIVQVRLVLAKQLLAETDMKIYEIAQQTGFETPGYFTKVFNKVEKISPRNYRMNVSKNKAEM